MSSSARNRTQNSVASRLFSNRPHRFWLATLALMVFVLTAMTTHAQAPTVTFNGIPTVVNTGSFQVVLEGVVAVDGAGDV